MRTKIRALGFAFIGIFLSSCGAITSAHISNATSAEELASYSNKQLCNPFVEVTPIVSTERQRRNLGDCTSAHQACIAQGFEVGSDKYLSCREYMAQQDAANAVTDAANRAAYLQMMQTGANLLARPVQQPSPVTTTNCHYVGTFLQCTTF